MNYQEQCINSTVTHTHTCTLSLHARDLTTYKVTGLFPSMLSARMHITGALQATSGIVSSAARPPTGHCWKNPSRSHLLNAYVLYVCLATCSPPFS